MRAPALTPIDRAFADLVRTIRQARDPRRQQEPRAGPARRARSKPMRSGSASRSRSRAEHGEGLADLYDALRAALPDSRRAEHAARKIDAPTRASADPRRRGRAAQHRQVDADQPAARRGAAADRARGRHHPRRDRGRSRLAAAGVSASHDTAGLRRRSRIEEKLEKLSVADALNAIRFAEVVIVLIDAQAPFEEQDMRIADLVEREGRALVIGMNKWDLIERAPGALDASCARKPISGCRRSRACRSSPCRG